MIDSYSYYFLDQEKLSKTVRKFLKENNIKQEDFAISIGYTPSTLCNWLQGESTSRFIAGALITRLNLDINDYQRGRK